MQIIRTLTRHYGQLTYIPKWNPIKSFDHVQTFRLLDQNGKPFWTTANNYNSPTMSESIKLLPRILKTMVSVDQMDRLLLNIKNQGKISFYMTSFGEGAAVIGSSAGLSPTDWIYTQYRQQGALIWRGYSFDRVLHQCMGTIKDSGKGRQMPVHYGARDLNVVTLSSPLTTQLPQAVGTGYAFRTANQQRVCCVYLGQGAASQGDFPTALNFAATLKSQTLFICRNNKWAISTPSSDQYVCDGVAPRAIALGVASARVDGNDALAVLEATKYARNYILQEKKPFLLELMTYRIGDHSTSDNSTLYRSQAERAQWRDKQCPIKRLTQFLIDKQLWKQQQWAPNKDNKPSNPFTHNLIRLQTKTQITKSLNECSVTPFPSPLSMFDDVYQQLPAHLKQQKEELRQHLKVHGEKYKGWERFEKDGI